MDETSIELAKAGLDVYSAELSPLYKDMHDQLVGRLAINNIHLENLRAQEVTRQNNHRLISDVVELLPEGDFPGEVGLPDGMVMEADNPYVAKQIQSHVLWVRLLYNRSMDNPESVVIPFYIIGSKQIGTGEATDPSAKHTQTELLLMAPRPYSKDSIVTAKVWEHEFEAMRLRAQKAMFRDYTPEELESLFDPERGNLVLKGRGDCMWTARSGLKLNRFARKLRRSEADVINRRGMRVAINPDKYLKGEGLTIDDNVLAEYDVFTYLNNLATAFGKVDELHKLLDKYKSQIPHDEAQPPTNV